MVRVVSAVIAALAVIAVAYWGGAHYVLGLAGFVIIWGIYEFISMVFPSTSTPRLLKAWVAVYALGCFSGLFFLFNFSLSILCLSTIIFYSGSLWITRNKISNAGLLQFLSSASLGVLYFVTFPVFALKMLQMYDGLMWFGFLLLVVFAGDTFAYFGGRLWGKRTLMPQISPKKTVAGSVTGLAGSCVVGVVFLMIFLPDLAWYWTAFCSVVCGLFAQTGDLFVSLVKRVANVKDSGRIMPGHGGVLDRLDGVYIAAPLVYGFARFTQYLLA